MRRAVTVGLLTIIFGCTESQKETNTVDRSANELTVPSANASIALPDSNGPTAAEYPEKTDVARLLSRAVVLESDGKFQEALSIVNEALAVDENSPRAVTYKQRLEDLIRRI